MDEEKCFNYDAVWEKKENKKLEKEIEKLPRGFPRKGIKGRYIKKKGNVSRRQIGLSYGKYFKSVGEENSSI